MMAAVCQVILATGVLHCAAPSSPQEAFQGWTQAKRAWEMNPAHTMTAPSIINSNSPQWEAVLAVQPK